MGKEISINSEKLEKSFRNFIRNLRKRTADKAAKSETVIKLNQKKMR